MFIATRSPLLCRMFLVRVENLGCPLKIAESGINKDREAPFSGVGQSTGHVNSGLPSLHTHKLRPMRAYFVISVSGPSETTSPKHRIQCVAFSSIHGLVFFLVATSRSFTTPPAAIDNEILLFALYIISNLSFLIYMYIDCFSLY